MKRRHVLRLGAALPLAGMPALAATNADTPVLALFRQWCAAHGALRRDDNDIWRITPQVTALADRLLALPSTGPADTAAKVLVATRDGTFLIAPALLRAELHALTGQTGDRA